MHLHLYIAKLRACDALYLLPYELCGKPSCECITYLCYIVCGSSETTCYTSGVSNQRFHNLQLHTRWSRLIIANGMAFSLDKKYIIIMIFTLMASCYTTSTATWVRHPIITLCYYSRVHTYFFRFTRCRSLRMQEVVRNPIVPPLYYSIHVSLDLPDCQYDGNVRGGLNPWQNGKILTNRKLRTVGKPPIISPRQTSPDIFS